jgi:hypothetical protein
MVVADAVVLVEACVCCVYVMKGGRARRGGLLARWMGRNARRYCVWNYFPPSQTHSDSDAGLSAVLLPALYVLVA